MANQIPFSIDADTTPGELPIPEDWRTKFWGSEVTIIINAAPSVDVHLVEESTDTEGIIVPSSGGSFPLQIGPLPAARFPRFAYAASTEGIEGVILRTK